jgi:hypothetical protein
MYQHLQPVSFETDANTTFTRPPNWNFASKLTMIDLTNDEMPLIAQEYAIVFTSDTPSLPVALLGVDGANCYLTPEGDWTAHHIPARVRFYPFSTTLSGNQVLIVRATDAAHFQGGEGQPLYNQQGKPAPVLELAKQMVADAHVGLVTAAHLTAQLAGAGLLADLTVQLAQADGTVKTFNGFKGVNEAALAGLDADTRAALNASGAMAMLDAHRASLSNFSRLLPAADKTAAKKARATRAAAKADDTATDGDEKKPARKPRAKKAE